MKIRHFLLTASLAIAVWFALFGDKTPPSDIAEPVTHRSVLIESSPMATHRSPPGASTQTSRILILHARDTFIGKKQDKPPTEELFRSQNWMPPPPKALPPPPPTAPPLPFTYFGKKLEDGIWEVYLSRGSQSLIVREKTVIENTYRIDSIKPPSLSLTYLPLNQVQWLPIGGTD
jgi:hypothetical protein